MTQDNIKYIALGDIPEYKETRLRGGWLSYGNNNALCRELIELYNNSSKHNALITGKVNYVKGQGLKTDDIALKRLFARPNIFEDGNEILEKIVTDLELFGGFYLQLVFGKMGGQLTDYYHLPFQNCVPNENGQEIFYSEEVEKGIKMSNGKVYEIYNGVNQGTKVLYVKKYRAGSGILTLPDYYASLRYIKIDSEIANFHYNNLISGFSAGTMIVLHNGEPDADTKRKIAREFKKNTTGTDNGGGVFIHYANPNEKEPTLIPLNGNDLPDRFNILNEQVQQEIFIGHKVVNPILFGVKTEGQLGGRNEIIEAFELFKQSYIEPQQKCIVSAFNLLGRINGAQSGCSIETASPLGLDYLELYREAVIDRATLQRELGLEISQPQQTRMSEHICCSDHSERETYEAMGWRNDDIIEFEKHGEPKENYEVLHTLKVNFARDEQGARALKIIQDNPGITTAELLNILNATASEGKALIDEMVAEQLMTTEGGLAVSEEGLKVVKEFSPSELIVRYEYSGVRDNRNRDFCARLLQLGRLYSREDIDTLSRILGYNVWKRRGGWYHNPQLNVNLPHCRHEWSQVIVRRR